MSGCKDFGEALAIVTQDTDHLCGNPLVQQEDPQWAEDPQSLGFSLFSRERALNHLYKIEVGYKLINKVRPSAPLSTYG